MKDLEMKKLFDNFKIEEPSLGFEERIIRNAIKAPQTKSGFTARFVAMAAMFLFIFSFGLMNFNSVEQEQQAEREYAAMVEETPIIDEDDVYGDLIVAYNY